MNFSLVRKEANPIFFLSGVQVQASSVSVTMCSKLQPTPLAAGTHCGILPHGVDSPLRQIHL
jgi:hypothetical protein